MGKSPAGRSGPYPGLETPCEDTASPKKSTQVDLGAGQGTTSVPRVVQVEQGASVVLQLCPVLPHSPEAREEWKTLSALETSVIGKISQ